MKESTNVHAKTVEAPAGGLNLSDIYYIFFRHKWMIMLSLLAGVVGAAGFYALKPPLYQSEAKIFIRYILEAKATSPAAGDSQIKSPDSGGQNIINSEIEILTSLDLAGQVAGAIGPEKLLAKLGGGNDRASAAGVIQNGLRVEVPRASSILRIEFRHPDPAVVQPVLSQLVDTYLKKHVEIHQGIGVLDDFFTRQAEQLRSRLSQTEQELKKLKTDAQVISLEDDKQNYIKQIAKIEEDLRVVETELAEHRAALGAFTKALPDGPSDQAVDAAVPADKAEHYRTVCAELEALTKRQRDLALRFTDEHPLVKRLRDQTAETRTLKRQLEEADPRLVSLTLPSSTTATAELGPVAEALRVSALESKIKVLNAQLEKVRGAATRLVEVEPAITQLQRQKELEEANYRFYSSSLEQARLDESRGAGKITNISVVQSPSPPGRDMRKLRKPMALILALGLFGGLGLAFVKERFLDQTFKRVVDVERNLHIPLFLSIPDMSWNRVFRLPRFFRNGHQKVKRKSDVGTGPEVEPPQQASRTDLAPWDPQHGLRGYYAGLRDRLITYFEIRNMTRRPKLVAITGCARGAGVTTIAAGLAATLSETGDGNVLLVDMNLEQGAAHPFYRGKPGCGLSEAFESEKRDTALVQDNLYLASAHEANHHKLPHVLPKHFAHLVPTMKASDYDYIIFDMPPITQTSVTPRLAGFMDIVLMVLESEKTGQEIARRADALLNESRANVAAVLNKHREYVPQRLSQEL